jgi:hypothetical protein
MKIGDEPARRPRSTPTATRLPEGRAVTDKLDRYYTDVVLPCKGFNLWHYMSCQRVKDWDFPKIREELDRIEELVRAATGVPQ